MMLAETATPGAGAGEAVLFSKKILHPTPEASAGPAALTIEHVIVGATALFFATAPGSDLLECPLIGPVPRQNLVPGPTG
jgi:hypothetical protein